MKVVWIASYPKSGNTLVRMLLHNYLFGVANDTDLVAERIPGIHAILTQGIELDISGEGKKLVKSHFCFSRQHPYAEATAGFIYIVRNPRDVLRSNARYLGATSNKDDFRKFAELFIENMGAPRWREMGMGSWNEHLASWLAYTGKVPHFFVKYEDIRSDTAKILKHLISFIGLVPEEHNIKTAVESCDIEKARKHELEEKKSKRTKVYNLLPNNENFVGEGRSGQSLVDIGEDIERLYRKRFGKVATLFNYD
jgi:hypothetical protein